MDLDTLTDATEPYISISGVIEVEETDACVDSLDVSIDMGCNGV
jgi:hypothetical protein